MQRKIELLARAKSQAELCELILRQCPRHIDIDILSNEGRGELAEIELREELRQRGHGGD